MSVARSRTTARGAIVAAASLILLAGCNTATFPSLASGANTAQPPSPASPVRAAPSWSDEFDGPAGSPPDPAKWGFTTGGNGAGNRELEYYTDSPSNAALDGHGDLVITARAGSDGHSCWYGTCQYTSARLNTQHKFSQAYGHFEARMAMPESQGLWPSLWMLGDNIDSVGWPTAGEIDIAEHIGREPGVVHGVLHGLNNGIKGGTVTLPDGSGVDQFHVYAMDWTPDVASFSVDGHTYFTQHRSDAGSVWVFDHPFYLILNVAVGGTWPGAPDSSTTFPQQMVVDYVRAYDSVSPTK